MFPVPKSSPMRGARAKPKSKVSLPPPPPGLGLDGFREVKIRTAIGTRRVLRPVDPRLARRSLQQDVIDRRDVLPDGTVVKSRAKVWRVADRRAWRYLTLDAKAALQNYAELVEQVGSAGGGASNFADGGGSGGSAGSRPPSLHKLQCAEALAELDARMEGGVLTVVIGYCRNPVALKVHYRELVRWVAVDCLTRTEILRRMGYPNPEGGVSSVPGERVVEAVLAITERLMAHCAGPANSARNENNSGNGPRSVA